MTVQASRTMSPLSVTDYVDAIPMDSYDICGDNDSCILTDSKVCARPLTEQSSVSFNPIVSIHEVMHINDYTPQEIDAVWLQSTDYRNIQEERKQSIRYMLKYGIADDDIEFCSRGLETKSDSLARRQNKMEAFEAVANEQYLQIVEGTDLPELIAMLYSVYSLPCQKKAHITALRDAQAADMCCSIQSSLELLELEESDTFYASESVIELLAQEEQMGGKETFSSIEEWLVDRFEKGQQIAQPYNDYNTSMDME